MFVGDDDPLNSPWFDYEQEKKKGDPKHLSFYSPIPTRDGIFNNMGIFNKLACDIHPIDSDVVAIIRIM